jgi:hypothetical protein
MAKPTTICVDCQVEYQVHQIGVPVITLFLDPPQPYEIGFADLYECPGCQHVVVSAHSYSDWPFRRHHGEDFEDELKAAIQSATLANKPIIYVYENHLHVPGKEPTSRRLLRAAGKIK